MGGEGAMMAAINSLRNNRSLVTKRKERSALSGSYSDVKMKDFPNATPEALIKLRNRIQAENIENRKKIILVFVLVLLLLTAISVYLLQ